MIEGRQIDLERGNGDKCAWMNTQNTTLGGHQFAVQPLWSNEAFDATGNGCVVTR